jgi:putative SOS response-associated peptidase YedK
MCGRFSYRQTPLKTREYFGVADDLDLSPRYNIAPTQQVLTVGQTREGGRKAARLRWGLIPSWAKEIPAKTFNARDDALLLKPTWREAFARRRCLVLADGFYEWDRQRLAVYFYMEGGKPFAFAGLWDTWRGPDGRTVSSCAVITTEPNALLRPVHDRMPAILSPEDYDLWLDREGGNLRDLRDLRDLLRPYPHQLMSSHPVSRRVNDVRNDDAGCSAPLNLSLSY